MNSAALTSDSRNTSEQQSDQRETISQKSPALLASLRDYAKLGVTAALLLGLLELIDVHIHLSPVLRSITDRLAFTAYFSLNLLSGLLTGAVVGLYFYAATIGYNRLLGLISRGKPATLAHKIIAGLGVSAVAALVLNQIPAVYRYVIALMIEAQKLPFMYGYILKYKVAVSYLVLFALIIACSVVFILTGAIARGTKLLRALWIGVLLVSIAATYYVDSRIEVELYGYSLHRTMFLLATTLALALVATLYLSSPRLQDVARFKSPLKKSLAVAASIALAVLVGFTFYHFDKNQNLKTQIFTRTTQAKQHFMFAQWALEFDRDGYSKVLGGGDADDFNADIHPEEAETIGDGIDNNGIAGELVAQQVEDWKRERSQLNVAQNPAARPMNIIYFFIDAVRADHFGAYGYDRPTTPNIDRLAARSSIFENAYSPSANTFEAAPKFMQASYWDAKLETWTEALARNGYETYLFPSHRLPMLRRYVKGVNVVEEARGKRLDKTISLVIDTISNTPPDRPFISYVYIPDPHAPYKKHADFDFGPSELDRYDGELAYTDNQLGRLFDWMEQTGRMDDTMIVIMSDHGESFGERMVYRHSSQLYNEQTLVPMIVYAPGFAPRRIPDYVSTIDLGPTILSAVGIDIPQNYVGVSLIPLMRGESFLHPPIYGEESYKPSDFPNVRPEENPQTVISKYMIITQDGYKLIFNRAFNTYELFNLKQDPKEENNLFNRETEKAAELRQKLGLFVDIVTASRPWDADESRFLFGRDDNRESWDEGDF